MKLNTKTVIIILSIILLFLPLIIYLINFGSHPLSDETEIWGQFGGYLNGTFMPLIALTGVFVTLYLGIISERRNKANLVIEQQKRRPLLHLEYFDGEDIMFINIINKGDGPLIITDYYLLNIITNEIKASIFEILPSIKIKYDNYSGNLKNQVLSANEEMEIFLFALFYEDENDNNIIAEYEDAKLKVRTIFKDYKIVFKYKDVYGNKMDDYIVSLEWFGRNIKKNNNGL